MGDEAEGQDFTHGQRTNSDEVGESLWESSEWCVDQVPSLEWCISVRVTVRASGSHT
jgi:hypothetical protein